MYAQVYFLGGIRGHTVPLIEIMHTGAESGLEVFDVVRFEAEARKVLEPRIGGPYNLFRSIRGLDKMKNRWRERINREVETKQNGI